MDRRRLRATATSLAIVLPLLLAACGVADGPTITPTPSPSPGGTPSPSPSPGATLTAPELKLRLLASFGSLWYCDPDEFPVAHGDEATLAAERLPEIRDDVAAWAAITGALGFDPNEATLPPDQVLAIYRTWKVLGAIELTPVGGGFGFDELFGPKDVAGQVGEHVTGTIDDVGAITMGLREVAGPPNCPICLARGTTILVRGGSVAVERLTAGSTVWTLDAVGRRVEGTVLAVASTPVSASHRVVRLVLSDGRSVDASPGHPLADGRLLGALREGDLVDGARVVSADLVAYDGGRTFDLRVSGATGVYFAGDGIPLATTMTR